MTGERVFNPRQTPVPVPNPPPLFHATDAVLAPGDVIVPGLACGRSRSPWVYLADDPGSSSVWGSIVYEADPVGDVQACRSNYRARSARVLKVVPG